MAHTPLFETLVHAFRVAGESTMTGRPVEAILEQQAREANGDRLQELDDLRLMLVGGGGLAVNFG